MLGLSLGLGVGTQQASGGGGASLPTVALATSGVNKSTALTLTNSNKTATVSNGNRGAVRADHASSTTKWQFEMSIDAGIGAAWLSVEPGTDDLSNTADVPGWTTAHGVSAQAALSDDFQIQKDGIFRQEIAAYNPAVGDRIGVIVDQGAATIQFYSVRSGVVTLRGTAESWTPPSGNWYACVGLYQNTGNAVTITPGAGQTRTLDSGFTTYGA